MINSAELLLAVTPEDSPLHPMTREFIHLHGFWHRTSHIWIINSHKEILCHQRSLLKHSAPGKWEACFGGHLAYNEDYLQGALKELREETGIEAPAEELNFFTMYKNDQEKEFQSVYFLGWEGKFEELSLEEEEVAEVEWVPIDQVEKLIEEDAEWLRNGYANKLLEHLKHLQLS